MFCPNCRDEFRPGFTRCAECDVELVPDLDGAAPSSSPSREAHTGRDPGPFVEMASFCGFLDLADARHARDTLRQAGIQWEIAIREAPDSPAGGDAREEYWLRVEQARQADALALLGYDPGEPEESDGSDEERS